MARSLRFNSMSNADIFFRQSVGRELRRVVCIRSQIACDGLSFLPQKGHIRFNTYPTEKSCNGFPWSLLFNTKPQPTQVLTLTESRNVHAFETRKELCTFENETAPCLHYIYILRLDRGDAGEQTAMARWEQNKKNIFQLQLPSDSLF